MTQKRIEGSPKIQAAHRERQAWIYIRQSSLRQVENHQESRRRQYDLMGWAVDLGWPQERIVVVDEDQGKSSMTPGARTGFARLVGAVASEEVGIVIGLEVSRLARNSPDWHSLMYLCRWTKTLIGDEYGVHDPAVSSDRMVLNLRGQMSELELETSIHRMAAARWNKAQRGELLTIPPAGYDIDDLGQLVVTSDEAVAHAVRTVFNKFDEYGAARPIYVWWREQGLSYPVRRKERRGHPVEWVKPTYPRILRTLRNPIFAGAYAFGKSEGVRTVEDASAPRVVVRRRARSQWPVLIHDHHPAYISFEKYLQIRERLVTNRGMKESNSESRGGAAREGRALLQGLARCGACSRRMYVAYGGNRAGKKRRTYQYVCRAERGAEDTRHCQSVGGKQIDAIVVETFLEVTQPAGIDAALLAAEQARADALELERWWQLRIEKAEFEAQRAERQYNAVEPENRVVARELERRWNARLMDLELIKKEAETKLESQEPLTEKEIETTRRLGKDLERLWYSEATTARDKKRLLRTLIDEVQIRTDDSTYSVRMVWKGGALTEREIPRRPQRPLQATSEDTIELIRKLATDLDDAQIAVVLNKQGRRSAQDKTFTAVSVRMLRRRNGIARCEKTRARSPKEGPFTAEQAARELGVSMSTVHRWLREGVLPGKQMTPGAPWQITLPTELRHRLTGGNAPPGWMGLTAAAKHLGLTKSSVAHLVNSGQLEAVRVRAGKRQCWKINVDSANCGSQTQLFEGENGK